MFDGWVIVERSGDADAVVLEDFSGGGDLVRPHQGRERRPALVPHAQIDIEPVCVEQLLRHVGQRRRAVDVHGARQPAGPAKKKQWSIPGVVIRVLVRDEDGAQVTQRQLRERKLPCDAIAAVDQVDAVADNDGLCGRGGFRLRSRTAGGAEKHQPCPRPALLRASQSGIGEKGGPSRDECAT